MPTFASSQTAIIRIKVDGQVEGTEKFLRDGDIYVLTSNLTSSVGSDQAFIFIEHSNIILDGAGFTVSGEGFGTAFLMLRSQNVTVKNFNIIGFETGFNFWTVKNWPYDSKYWGLPSASENKILNNNITTSSGNNLFSMESGWGIYLQEAFNTQISGNNIFSTDNTGGLYFGWDVGGTLLSENHFVNCGLQIRESNQTRAFNNTINGEPLIFFDGESNQIIDYAGSVYLFNSEKILVKNINSSGFHQSIQLGNSTNVMVRNSTSLISLIDSNNNIICYNFPKKIELYQSSNNILFGNTINDVGVCIQISGHSMYNKIYNNTLLNTKNSTDVEVLHYSGKNPTGILIGESNNNDIFVNTLINHGVGIELRGSSKNNIYGNMISLTNHGIKLSVANQNNITQNNIFNCNLAIGIVGSNNSVYNNNFINNTNQVLISHQMLFSSNIIATYSLNNTFDCGYSIGGNYWSDYHGNDKNTDGIGDTPYIINKENQDNYPLISPKQITSNIPAPPNFEINISKPYLPDSSNLEPHPSFSPVIPPTTVSPSPETEHVVADDSPKPLNSKLLIGIILSISIIALVLLLFARIFRKARKKI